MTERLLANVRVKKDLISIFGDKRRYSEMYFGLFCFFFLHQFAFTVYDVCKIKTLNCDGVNKLQ